MADRVAIVTASGRGIGEAVARNVMSRRDDRAIPAALNRVRC